MSDTPWNDAGATTSPEPAPARPARQKRKAKPEAAPKARKPLELLIANPKPVRKPREPKAERAAPETVKISIKDYAEMRVTAFQREFVKLHKILAPISAKARNQIIAELQKVFG